MGRFWHRLLLAARNVVAGLVALMILLGNLAAGILAIFQLIALVSK